MKTGMLILIALVFSLPQLSSAAEKATRYPAANGNGIELCGVLHGECINGGTCAHFLNTDNGEIALIGSNKKIAAELSDFNEKPVCATGHYSRQGFVASSLRPVTTE